MENLTPREIEVLQSIKRGITDGIQMASGKKPYPKKSTRQSMLELIEETENEEN